MPQMSPFNWTILLLMFLSALTFTVSKISFTKTLKTNSSLNTSKTNKYFSWMW
uniref:ATP synthase F0 subunit 8 n=1 Tax=Brachystomella parvula TaxID=187611 RepID=A0A650BKH8_9HEXA|nr:ATP synthase F0 subunit 8 [Brachystomella parvula]